MPTVLIAAYAVAALRLHSASVLPATLTGVPYSFLLYNILPVYKKVLYLVLTVPYAVSKYFQ